MHTIEVDIRGLPERSQEVIVRFVEELEVDEARLDPGTIRVLARIAACWAVMEPERERRYNFGRNTREQACLSLGLIMGALAMHAALNDDQDGGE